MLIGQLPSREVTRTWHPKLGPKLIFDLRMDAGTFSSPGSEPRNVRLSRTSRIQHGVVPFAVANGLADARLIVHHMALYYAETLPKEFEVVSLPGAERRSSDRKSTSPGF